MILRFKQNASTLLKLSRQFYREFHLTKSVNLNPNNVTEVRIPVPWGHIAGKWWGDTNEQPILALHGWQDNACSFDALLELLPSTKPVLVIDIPGHGFSSHFPPGMIYQSANYVSICRRIQEYFKWNEKITFLGHSMGGITAFVFSALYPESVKALIGLDSLKPWDPVPLFFSKLGKMMDNYIDVAKRVTDINPKYTIEEIEERWLKAANGSLTPEATRILMKRAVKFDEETGKYSFTRDPKLKALSLYRYHEEESLELASSLRCHYLVIKFSKGVLRDAIKDPTTVINTLNKSAKSFKMVTVEGTHHCHLINPESCVPIIQEFLTNVES